MSKQTVKGLWRRIFGALLTLSMLASLMPMTSSAAQKSNPPRSLGFSVRQYGNCEMGNSRSGCRVVSKLGISDRTVL